MSDEAEAMMTAKLEAMPQRAAYIELHAGAGGDECWQRTLQLAAMYRGWRTSDMIDDNAIRIPNGWPLLSNETGVHRMLTWSGGKRQTTCTMIRVVPETAQQSIVLKKTDLEWQTYRSGGKGGQNVNKVETACRVKHLPSGLVAQCQTTRSQAQNRELALRLLQSKVESAAFVQKARGETPMSFGHQIRNYWLAPEHRIKETRIDWQTNRTDEILSGKLDALLLALARQLGVCI
jgi:peptide chain release factor 2